MDMCQAAARLGGRGGRCSAAEIHEPAPRRVWPRRHRWIVCSNNYESTLGIIVHPSDWLTYMLIVIIVLDYEIIPTP